MAALKRQITRLLRLRNLILLTAALMIVYLVKAILGETEIKPSHLQPEQADQGLSFEKDYLSQQYFVPSSLQKIDWHNYTQIEIEAKRSGIGEQGRPAHLPLEDASKEEKLYSVNGFNGALSDKISLNRSLPDIRHPGCMERKYIKSLPSVSVVVPFHNEHWSTLLRTAQSVLNRSPEHLIKEILLVDDASTKEFLGPKLDNYLRDHMPKVKVVRVRSRSGLITARLSGARLATGDVLVFLDSHSEANVNWLPPLLEPIALDYRTAMCPYIDVVAYDTFEYRAQDQGARGAFDWELFYKRLPLLPKDKENMPEPFVSPVMAGGLFAISRAFFWELGGYDPGLDIWGGEQYELSFKIWQCGGRMLDAPCSRVGHIYRKFSPFPNPGRGDFVGKNYRRVAAVWMDEYAQHLYRRRPHYLRIYPGDISEQIALRKRLKCKSFKWFITQIAFDLPVKYPPIVPPPYADGRIRPALHPKYCLDASHGGEKDRVKLSLCTQSTSVEQNFILTFNRDIKTKNRNMCLDLPESTPHSPIVLFKCHTDGGNQLWKYDIKTKQIKHGGLYSCIDWDMDTRSLFINSCDSYKDTQLWTIDNLNKDMLAKWDVLKKDIVEPQEVVLE